MKLEILKNKILVLGGYGMAGHTIARYLILKNYDVSVTVRHAKNIFNKEIIWIGENFLELEKIINKFDIVINCIGILNNGNFSFNEMEKINTDLPLFLNKITEKNRIKFIHLSTDCVFSGLNSDFYLEDSQKDGNDDYAITKSNGEFISDRNLVIRKSLIGTNLNGKGNGLLTWFLKNKKDVDGYANWYWSGITTIILAKAIEFAFTKNISGILHISNGERISKFDLLNICNEVYGVNKKIIKKYLEKEINKFLISSRKDFNFFVPSYRDMIIDMFNYENQDV